MSSVNKNIKKIVFLTGTRADFGKLKSLIKITQESETFEVHIFATGMHLNKMYGLTSNEIYKAGFINIFPFVNHEEVGHMDRVLAKTINGFSCYVSEIEPDLILVHGDRVETMAGAIVGSLNNILVAHIEGGEISGTIDELIRHSVSKMSHIHLTTNQKAKSRLIQLGELSSSIFVIGSPDLDLMNSKQIPTLSEVKSYYNIEFDKYSVAMFHPVTTEYKNIKKDIKNFVDALIESDKNYILIYPNNDLGSIEILKEYRRLKDNRKVCIFPSLRFEYFLKLLKNSQFMIGNSSAGIREAPYYQISSVNIGTRQNNRVALESVINCQYDRKSILKAIIKAENLKVVVNTQEFGQGDSNKLFLDLLNQDSFWKIDCQKQFQEME
jgi:UDP-N-acetylglucosamine 2-epimerase (hydrolysing)